MIGDYASTAAYSICAERLVSSLDLVVLIQNTVAFDDRFIPVRLSCSAHRQRAVTCL